MTPDEGARSPWITVWFSPRLTIERLVMTRPTYFVWLLAITGTIASLYNQISVIDGATYLLNWKLALGLVLLGIFAGIAWYLLRRYMKYDKSEKPTIALAFGATFWNRSPPSWRKAVRSTSWRSSNWSTACCRFSRSTRPGMKCASGIL